jgi:hypothetical protein
LAFDYLKSHDINARHTQTKISTVGKLKELVAFMCVACGGRITFFLPPTPLADVYS